MIQALLLTFLLTLAKTDNHELKKRKTSINRPDFMQPCGSDSTLLTNYNHVEIMYEHEKSTVLTFF